MYFVFAIDLSLDGQKNLFKIFIRIDKKKTWFVLFARYFLQFQMS